MQFFLSLNTWSTNIENRSTNISYNFLVVGCRFFVSDIISSFLAILAHVAWPRAQLPGQSISLNFSLETRLKSEYFELLIDLLAFLVQKL